MPRFLPSSFLLLTWFALLAAFALPVAAKPTATPRGGTGAKPLEDRAELLWGTDLGDARAHAAADFRPIVAVFTMPACLWCKRMKGEVFTEADTADLLQHFVRVEIDITRNPETAASFGVRSVPALAILSADGKVRESAGGYLAPPEVQRMLKGALNTEFLRNTDPAHAAMLKMLAAPPVGAEAWPDILGAMGQKAKRDDIRRLVLSMDPFPKEDLVALLENDRLALRLGALELLEEKTGETRGYDPWFDKSTLESNTNALADWKAWARGEAAPEKDAAQSLGTDEIEAQIPDLVSENIERRRRAIHVLKNGGSGVVSALGRLIADNSALDEGSLLRLREAQYTLALPQSISTDREGFAHRLVFGNLDARATALNALGKAGPEAAPILAEFIDHPEPLIRETAVDALAATAGREAVDLLVGRLESETNKNVAYTILRNLGGMPSKRGLATLVSRMNDADEDFAVVALEGVARLKQDTPETTAGIRKGLADPRWRVRVAALEAIAKIGMTTFAEDAVALASDPDAFVRSTAVETLSEIGTVGSLEKLRSQVADTPEMLPVVVKAYVARELPVPDDLIATLRDAGSETLLPVLEIVRAAKDKHYLDFARDLIGNPDKDIAAAALRNLAARGAADPEVLVLLSDLIRSGTPDEARSILEALSLDDDALKLYRRSLPSELPGGAGTPDASGPPSAADETVQAFLAEYNRVAATASVTLDEKAKRFADLIAAIESRLASEDPLVRFAAGQKLLDTGSPAPMEPLLALVDERTTSDRTRLAWSMSARTSRAAIPLLRILLRDSTSAVREAAASAAFEHPDDPGFLALVFEELLDPVTKLTPGEAWSYTYTNALESPSGGPAIAVHLRDILARRADRALLAFALVGLGKAWQPGDLEIVTPFLAHEDPYLRRAAWHAVGTNAPDTFKAELARVTTDTSELVRLVVPKIFARHDVEWVAHFSAKESTVISEYWHDPYAYSSRRAPSKPELDPEVLAALRALASDPSPRVRMEASFTLLSNGQAIDVDSFIATVNQFPDRDAAAERIAEYLTEHYRNLDKSADRGLAKLVTFLDGSEESENEVKAVHDWFGTRSAQAKVRLSLLDAEAAPPEVSMGPVPPPEPETVDPVPDEAPPPSTVKVLYFYQPGCEVCERVEDDLKLLGQRFPLEVESLNNTLVSSKRLHEALCERFAVPEAIRLVAPAVYTAAGFRIKNEATLPELEKLFAKTLGQPADDTWHVISEPELAVAELAIVERFDTLRAGIVIGAGLLDGINPCAFATIIFFISYLTVARRNPRQIFQVGFAFILGVFLAYFSIGLGLMKIMDSLQAFGWIRAGINYTLAAMALVIMVLSVRDGVLCLQGRLADTTLQLPGFLKARINTIIRKGARHSRFVLAAFVVGLLISLLEFACTGQVYLPTITYNIQAGSTGAILYLLLFNLAFITPLVIIFLLAFFGMKSDTLVRFQKKHTAAVKFATALLFLALAALLVFGPPIPS